MTTAENPPGPDERIFRYHLGCVAFVAGESAGRWRLVSVDWPHAVIAIAAALRPDALDEVVLRFELTNYPNGAPTGMPWDIDRGQQLDHRRYPKGEVVGPVFRTDWENGRALYTAYDRVALQSHSDWVSRYPRSAWNPSRTIVFYLNQVHAILNDTGYTGIA